MGFIGNLTIVFLSILSIIYGGLIGEKTSPLAFSGIYAFLIILGREIVKNIEGDRAHGVKALPTADVNPLEDSITMLIVSIICALTQGFTLFTILLIALVSSIVEKPTVALYSK